MAVNENNESFPGGTKLEGGKHSMAGGRQARILELVRSQGYVSIDSLSNYFEVTPQTIRRDINRLCRQGLLRRFHGGAGLPSSVENVSYSTRQVLSQDEKRRIAKLVAAHVPDKASLFINIGTTTEEIARALLNHRDLRIITNNLNVAHILSTNEEFEVIITGGLVRSRDGGIVGESAISFIQQFKVDYGIIGISGIDEDGSLLEFDYREVQVARAIINNSRRVYLAADHTKFKRSAMVRQAHISEVDAVFTNSPPPAALREVIKESNVKLYVYEETDWES